jgi:NAD(P)H-flavin reductase
MKNNLICKLASNYKVSNEIFILQFLWEGHIPQAGQFFMIKPLRSSVFLARPISVFEFNKEQKTVKFLIAKRGKGTEELTKMHTGEEVELTGPLGNAWADFLPEKGKTALIGGGVGIAPLSALAAERPDYGFHFFAGFKKSFHNNDKETAMLGGAVNSKKLFVCAEDRWNPLKGLIVDYFDEKDGYNLVFACGSIPMLKAIKEKCDKANIPCFFSMEKRMACGIGACLGCTINTTKGGRRCCADGPIFPAQELFLNE